MKFLESIADKLWGPKITDYIPNHRMVADVDIDHFRGDRHEVVLTFHKHVKGRLRGPKRARKPHLQGYLVGWECVKGIPVRNDVWAGDYIYADMFSIKDSVNWYEEAVKGLHRQIVRQRVHNGYIHDRRNR